MAKNKDKRKEMNDADLEGVAGGTGGTVGGRAGVHYSHWTEAEKEAWEKEHGQPLPAVPGPLDQIGGPEGTYQGPGQHATGRLSDQPGGGI